MNKIFRIFICISYLIIFNSCDENNLNNEYTIFTVTQISDYSYPLTCTYGVEVNRFNGGHDLNQVTYFFFCDTIGKFNVGDTIQFVKIH